jgi:type III secretory pathway component EscR
MRRIGAALLLSLGLLAPIEVIGAQDHPRHEWNNSEDAAWRQYLKEHHKKYHDWAKAKKKEQEDYWKWRDQHRDIH